ncbi:acyltransferase [Limosilactobacillus pontis]
MRKQGVKVGKGVVIFRPFHTNIDMQNPHLLTIGNYVQMTGPVTVLTHDYSWSVIKRKYGGEILGNQRETTIGDNVFIGWGATILGGSKIGSNVIIGANSVVSGYVKENSVYAGNPAKYLMSLDEYYEKRKALQLKEAVNYVKKYKLRFNKLPLEKDLDEYFFLFRDNDYDKLFEKKLRLMGNYEESLNCLKNHHAKMFNNYNEFLDYAIHRK